MQIIDASIGPARADDINDINIPAVCPLDYRGN
jgi:hypothetical protein